MKCLLGVIITLQDKFASDDRQIIGYNMWSNGNMESLNRKRPEDKGWLNLLYMGQNKWEL